MGRRGFFFLIGSTLIGLVALFVFARVLMRPVPTSTDRPEVGGQQVPAAAHEILFDRRYDLFCSFFPDEPTIYRGCKILGFTGGGREDAGSRTGSSSVGFSGLSGSGSASAYRRHFDHWLVLELKDGRRAYIPPEAVRYLEEASAEVK